MLSWSLILPYLLFCIDFISWTVRILVFLFKVFSLKICLCHVFQKHILKCSGWEFTFSFCALLLNHSSPKWHGLNGGRQRVTETTCKRITWINLAKHDITFGKSFEVRSLNLVIWFINSVYGFTDFSFWWCYNWECPLSQR